MALGITVDTVRDTNQGIPVQISGEAKLLFNDTVASGALVGFDTSGRGIPLSLPNTTTSVTLASGYIGTLVGSAVAATSTVETVLINPGLVRTSV
jgi:hypothetical protein